MKNKLLQFGFICFVTVSQVIAAEISDANWAEMKSQAVNRKREIIHNTDGCDALYYPRYLEATKENFIKQRLINAKGSRVDTISYCPVNSGFGYLTSKTKAGDQLLIDPPHAKNKRNVTGELLKSGTDPLKIAEEFCRKNGFEFFISLRCNDTHDSTHCKAKPHFLFPPYKQKHPEYLMGSYTNRPPYCRWSAVDFTHKNVRERFVAIVKELISNYSPDGIELDFCRHLQYFKSVAWGKEASPAELKMMTDCIREIREFAEKTGRQRQHPILIAVRVPDSAGLCKAVGLDLETWLRDKLVDIVIGGFYVQFNPWQKMVDLCHKYGVKFYPSMDESRIRYVQKDFNRNTLNTDRARVAAALTAGADGIYYFNRYGAKNIGNMRGNMDDIRLDDKTYFITYRYYPLDLYVSTGAHYNNLQKLSPVTPTPLFPGKPVEYSLDFGDDFSNPVVKQAQPTVTVSTVTGEDSGKRLQISVNDIPLKPATSRGTNTTFFAPTEIFKPGLNKVTVSVLPAGKPSKREKIIMSGEQLLRGKNQALWRRLFAVHDYSNSERIINNAYLISDTGTEAGEMANLIYPLDAVGKELDVRFQAKVERATDKLSAVCRLADGENIEIITLQPDRIGLYFTGKSVPFITTDAFHNYEATMKHGNLILKVDGHELFNTQLTMKADNPTGYLKNNAYRAGNMNRQSLLFGSLSGPGTGAVLWKNILIVEDNDKIQLKDLKFEVKFPKTKHLAVYKSISPQWTFDFNVGNGTIPSLKNTRNSYSKTNMQIVDGENGGKALQLNHLNGYQAIMINDPQLTGVGSGILLAEWKIKYLEGAADKSGFCIVFKPINDRQQGLLCGFTFYDNEITAPWGTVKPAQSIKDKWNVFRVAIDVNKALARLWMNGKQIGEGKIPSRKKVAPGIFFGDGSGNVAGKAEIEYLKITAIKDK